MKYQCQVPPCSIYAEFPARTPRICGRHQLLDSRKGRFSTILLWAVLWVMAKYLEERARQLHDAGEIEKPEDMESVRGVLTASDVLDRVLQSRELFISIFDPDAVWPQEERDYFLETFPKVKRKPQVHMVGMYLKMCDDFSGHKIVRVTPDRVLTVYSNVGPNWVAARIRQLHGVLVNGAKMLLVTQPWKAELPKLEESKDAGHPGK